MQFAEIHGLTPFRCTTAGPRGFDYGFDANNRIKFEQRDSSVGDGFSYDPRNELTGFSRDGTVNANGTVTAPYHAEDHGIWGNPCALRSATMTCYQVG